MLVSTLDWPSRPTLYEVPPKKREVEQETGGELAVWRSIHDALRRDITGGRYRTGDRLPTEKALSDLFGVNRHTVRRALAELSRAGAITVRRGSGAYVAEGVLDYPLRPGARFKRSVLALGRKPSARILLATTDHADDAAASHLRLAHDAMVLTLTILRSVDDVPVLYTRHIFPADRFEGFAEVVERTGSVAEALAEVGHPDHRRAWTRFTAQPPTREMLEALGLFEGQPVLRTEFLIEDAVGAPIEYGVSGWAASRAQIVV